MLMIYMSVIETGEDRNKFKEIYEDYRQSLYLEALSIVKNPEDAEDIVEDTFLKVADNFTEISQKNRQKMRAYIVIINRNNAIDRYNQNKKSLEKNDDTPLEEIIDPNSKYNMMPRISCGPIASNISPAIIYRIVFILIDSLFPQVYYIFPIEKRQYKKPRPGLYFPSFQFCVLML